MTPTTQTLDIVTIDHALAALEHMLGGCGWQIGGSASNQKSQGVFLDWHYTNRATVDRIDEEWIKAKASTSYEELNNFLKEHGFDPEFQPFNGVGVASLFDLLVEWLNEGTLASIKANDTTYPAFTLESGFEMYQVGIGETWFEAPLIEIRTQSGLSLWIMTMSKAPDLDDPTCLALRATTLAQASKSYTDKYGHALTVPMLDINTRSNIDWLMGMSSDGAKHGELAITQAFQQFRLRMNERGARAQVATGMALERCAVPATTPHVIDRPFLGYFTLPRRIGYGFERLPLAPFFASYDAWKQPTTL